MRGYRAASLNALWFLIAANVLVFIVTLIKPEAIISLAWRPASFVQRPWIIVTSLFVHASFSHIICNMISLYFLGSFLIRLIGEKKFLIVYFIGGIVGNIFFIFPDPHAMGVGASGAIFAIGGALAMIAPRIPVFIFFIPIPTPLWVAIVIFLLISFVPGAGIAWQAHLGGLLAGLGCGYYFRRSGTYFR